MRACLVPVVLTAAASVWAGERPRSLIAMESNRSRIISGRIEWVMNYSDDPDNPRLYVQRMARNGDIIVEDRGDRNGRTLPMEGAPNHGGASTFPQVMMHNADGWWLWQETCGNAQLRDEYPKEDFKFSSMRDIRGLGMAPSIASLRPDIGAAAIWNDPDHKVVKWDEWRDAGKVHVRGECNTGGVYTWEIDPAKGFNADRITFEFEGQVTQEVICTLAQFDGNWLPARCEYREQGRFTRTFEIKQAQLNGDRDCGSFTPADMGIEPGVNISHPGHAYDSADEMPIWNGERLSTWGQFTRDVKAGRRKWGPTLLRIQDAGFNDSPYLTDEQRAQAVAQSKANGARSEIRRFAGIWEKYVRDFCRTNELDREQTGKANQILADCQKRAGEFVSRHEADLTECANRLIAARKEGKKDEIDRAQKRLDNLAAPIQDIFRKTLKPRLEGLLTAEQRERAAKRAEKPGQRDTKSAPDGAQNP